MSDFTSLIQADKDTIRRNDEYEEKWQRVGARKRVGSYWKGSYEGTFNGDDNGTWSAMVNVRGNINGTGYSDGALSSFILDGDVDKDSFSISSSTPFGDIFFTGDGDRSNNTITGTWVNNTLSLSGSFLGSKM